jgi:hypothetical protein
MCKRTQQKKSNNTQQQAEQIIYSCRFSYKILTFANKMAAVAMIAPSGPMSLNDASVRHYCYLCMCDNDTFQMNEDLYSRLKALQRQVEFLDIQVRDDL